MPITKPIKFNPKSDRPARAQQAWQILVSAAMNRQTLTYKLLANKMYQKEAAGVLAQTLGLVATFCIQRDLPALTSLVVNTTSGRPGDEIPVDQENIDQLRESVYQFDWFDLRPPLESELRE